MNPDNPIAWLNGRLLPFTEARLPLDDRGLLYGDSLFETVPVRHRHPFRWTAHHARLRQGSALTGIPLPLDPAGWQEALRALLDANAASEGTVRITVTRGPGRRGYSPVHAGPPNVFLTWHPGAASPDPHPGWDCITSRFRLASHCPLAQAKHGSRLLQVLARAEAEAAGAQEALLANETGCAVEAASGNLFWFESDSLCHPPDDAGGLPGITADVVAGIACAQGLTVRPARIPIAGLAFSQGAFLTLSTLGIVPVRSLDGVPLRVDPRTAPLATALLALMDAECRAGRDPSPQVSSPPVESV